MNHQPPLIHLLLCGVLICACGNVKNTSTGGGGEAAAGGSDPSSSTAGGGGTGDGGSTTESGCVLPPNLPSFIDLPQSYVDTTMPEQTGAVIEVGAGQSIQDAVDNAQPGDTIVLEAGASWTETVYLKDKGESTDWIVIRSSAMDRLPPEGVRVVPADAAQMPKILAPSGGTRALYANLKAHHYRIIGVEFGVAPSVNESLGVVELGRHKEGQDWNPIPDRPHHIVLDRVYVHGIAEPSGMGMIGTKVGVLFGGAHLAVIDSTISDIKKVGQDAYAIGSSSGNGPYKIINNYLAASGENILFGGGNTPDGDHNAKDVEICRNHLHKPVEWYDPNLKYKSKWSVKNLFELKHGQRIIVSGNVFENNWASAQSGWSLLFRSTDQGNAGTNSHQKTEDLVIAYNLITNVTNGLDINGRGGKDTNAGPTEDFYVVHNIFEKMGDDSSFGGEGLLFMFNRDVRNLHVVHNTGFNKKTYFTTHCTSQSQGCANPWSHALVQLLIRDNIMSYGEVGYGVHGPSGATDEEQFANATDENSALENNVIAHGKTKQYPSAKNFLVDDFDAVGFVDLAGGDYRLSDTSADKGKAEDGEDIGANVSAVLEIIKGVR